MAATQQDWNQLADAIEAADRDNPAFQVIATRVRLMAEPAWYPMDLEDQEFLRRYGPVMAAAREMRIFKHNLAVRELMTRPLNIAAPAAPDAAEDTER